MIVSAQTPYTILEYIASGGSVYDQIIDTIIAPNFHQKDELISELAVSYLNNKESVNKALKGGYFNYYFISSVKNQVHSSTSPFHFNVRQTSNQGIEASWLANSLEDDNEDLQYKMMIEEQQAILDEVLDEIHVTYFESEMFRMYYKEGLSFRKIEKVTGTDHVTVHSTVSNIRDKIFEQLEKRNIYNKERER